MILLLVTYYLQNTSKQTWTKLNTVTLNLRIHQPEGIWQSKELWSCLKKQFSSSQRKSYSSYSRSNTFRSLVILLLLSLLGAGGWGIQLGLHQEVLETVLKGIWPLKVWAETGIRNRSVKKAKVQKDTCTWCSLRHYLQQPRHGGTLNAHWQRKG